MAMVGVGVVEVGRGEGIGLWTGEVVGIGTEVGGVGGGAIVGNGRRPETEKEGFAGTRGVGAGGGGEERGGGDKTGRKLRRETGGVRREVG